MKLATSDIHQLALLNFQHSDLPGHPPGAGTPPDAHPWTAGLSAKASAKAGNECLDSSCIYHSFTVVTWLQAEKVHVCTLTCG